MSLFTVDYTKNNKKKTKRKIKGISRELLRKKFNINKLN